MHSRTLCTSSSDSLPKEVAQTTSKPVVGFFRWYNLHGSQLAGKAVVPIPKTIDTILFIRRNRPGKSHCDLLVAETRGDPQLHLVGLPHSIQYYLILIALLSRLWTRLYAAGLCLARNSAARVRPQRRQRQRRFAWSAFRLSGVSKWPLAQISGIAMGSRMRSREKHTTSVMVAPKQAPAVLSQPLTAPGNPLAPRRQYRRTALKALLARS